MEINDCLVAPTHVEGLLLGGPERRSEGGGAVEPVHGWKLQRAPRSSSHVLLMRLQYARTHRFSPSRMATTARWYPFGSIFGKLIRTR